VPPVIDVIDMFVAIITAVKIINEMEWNRLQIILFVMNI
jgi:hypothetical protein